MSKQKYKLVGNVERYLPLVRKLARRLQARLHLPAAVELADLVQVGCLGLLEALQRYDETLGASFTTFASKRISGAMLDELRQRDWLPRNVRQIYRQAEQTIQRLEQHYGQPVVPAEVARVMEMPLQNYYQQIKNVNPQPLESIDELDIKDWQYPTADIIEQLITNQRAYLVKQSLSLLVNQREKQAVELYFLQQWSLSEISAYLKVSESRVCQLHRQAFNKLRPYLQIHLEK